MLSFDWELPMPLHRLPTFVDFRSTGNAVSSLETLGTLCQIDNDILDVVARAQLIELQRLQTGMLPVPLAPLP